MIKTTNSLGYQTTGIVILQHKVIPSGLNYFDSSRLSRSTDKTTNLSNHSHYSNKAF